MHAAKLTAFANTYPRVEDVAKKAKKRIPHVAWEYLASATGDEQLLAKNKDAFNDLSFLPRFCKGSLSVNTKTELLGQHFDCPIGIAPVGLNRTTMAKNRILSSANSTNQQHTLLFKYGCYGNS